MKIQKKNGHIEVAKNSKRRRTHKILHDVGSYDNEVFNVMVSDSYMPPHYHPGTEKIEHIHVLFGCIDVLFFSDCGTITSGERLSSISKPNKIIIPAYSWHGYVVRSGSAITFETMQGVYSEATWKVLAPWAPPEDSEKASEYLIHLKKEVEQFLEN